MKLKITEKHLDKALAVKWSVDTCILQQVLKEKGLHLYEKGKSIYNYGKLGNEIMTMFDDGRTNALRKRLPIEVTFTKIEY